MCQFTLYMFPLEEMSIQPFCILYICEFLLHLGIFFIKLYCLYCAFQYFHLMIIFSLSFLVDKLLKISLNLYHIHQKIVYVSKYVLCIIVPGLTFKCSIHFKLIFMLCNVVVYINNYLFVQIFTFSTKLLLKIFSFAYYVLDLFAYVKCPYM